MLNVGSVLLSYQSVADRIVALVLGKYLFEDRFSHYFYTYVSRDAVEVISHVWDEDDVRQEVFLQWYPIIENYYSKEQACHRRGKGSLGAFLFKYGVLRIASKIRRIVRDFETSYKYFLECESITDPPSEVLFTDITLDALMRKPHFGVMDTLDGKARVFLYRFLIEDKSLKELTNEFGSWRDVQKILTRVHKLLFTS